MIELTTTRSSVPKSFTIGSWFEPRGRFLYADVFAVLSAVMLPWSTTGFTIFLLLWLISLIPLTSSADFRPFLHLVARPFCWLPLTMVLIAVVGTLWADVPWQARLVGIKPLAKLLVLPSLIFHFQRSPRGSWIFVSFVLSCALLMGLSWIVLFEPELKLTTTLSAGVPVKNYIDQSQEFALCMVALAPWTLSFYRQGSYYAAAACTVLILAFFANMAFVVSARAALVYIPVLLIVFASRYLNRRQSALLFGAGIVVAVAVWSTSGYLRARIADIWTEYQSSKQNIVRSTGQRLEYWEKSLKFFAEAPIFGNGTGSAQSLFERDAVGKTGLAAQVTKNPHNQSLNVAVQWGIIGIVALYAMWISHLWLFRGSGFASWLGLLIVVQNMTSSLFNSHLFDFHEGWMYVLGVGVAAGVSLQEKRRAATSHTRFVKVD
ncbi:O-antigen ligase family protein [Bradyrhizobium brasilense]|uniref:O-antigen ligase family protein n=1 Tax=Bradyrhizobium brasilense TaxID=1419277 RepID=UPI0028778818|nr:O-antigen ligase family protein [Bradyrhizobium brasilense]MCP3417919.1 O-antigen ligase family protein [Bradyrhizobium brasilense]